MNIAVCDDNRKVVDDIANYLSFFSKDTGTELSVFKYSSSVELRNANIRFDIAILDVEIDDVNGLKLGEELRRRNPHIILMYVTAYRKYLDEALNLNAVRFFEKPLDTRRFYKGLEEAIKRVDNSTIKYCLQDGRTTDTIAIQDIVYVEIEKRKSRVFTVDKSYHSSEHISFWQENLNASFFAVPHKSFIVNLNYITSYERSQITLCEKYKVNVARNRQTKFREKFLRIWSGNNARPSI